MEVAPPWQLQALQIIHRSRARQQPARAQPTPPANKILPVRRTLSPHSAVPAPAPMPTPSRVSLQALETPLLHRPKVRETTAQPAPTQRRVTRTLPHPPTPSATCLVGLRVVKPTQLQMRRATLCKTRRRCSR